MKRSKFSLSHTKLLSCNMGNLVPLTCMEVLPGDTFQHATSLLLRCSPLLTPVMHPVRVRVHHWYVPYRLIWEDFEKFITGGPDGMDASVYPTITFPNGGPEIGTLADYLGVPTDIVNAAGTEVSALPFRAYAKIFNDCYRDQDLVSALTIDETSGADTTTNTTLQRVAWEKDYFTSARPWEQKGPAVTIPIGDEAPVTGIGVQAGSGAFSAGNVWENGDTSATAYGSYWNTNIAVRAQSTAVPASGNTPQIFADLTSASAVTVNLLREALSMQRYEEARARYGSRYVEYLRYLGVRSSDARLQRPEYLGGGLQTIQFSEVLQTAEGSDPVGELRGHGIAAMRSNRYRRFFEEHGIVITLLSVLPKTIYMDGLFRMWNRRSKEDFWQKEFEHIGQQEVLNKEVRASHASPNGVFGYQDRYDEYRRMESSVSGEFRTTLNMWHFARAFGSDPALNSSFVQSTPTETPFAVPSADVLWVQAKHSVQARRMLSRVGKSFIY